MRIRVPASLRLTVPLILLGFAATLSAFNFLYHVPRAERAAEQESRKRLAQEMSRLQSTLEYLLLKGEQAIAQHEIAVLAHNHDYLYVCLTDDQGMVIATTRRAWLGREIAKAVAEFDAGEAARAVRERHARVVHDLGDDALLSYAGILMGRESEQLRPSRTGSLLLAYDLRRAKAEARAQVLQQSLYSALWVTALALAMWLVVHFLLTRRTARLVRAAEEIAAGDLSARSDLGGEDELGRLSRAFDAMAIRVAETRTRLQQDIAERARVQQALETSAEEYRSMFNASIDGLALWNAEAEMVDANPALSRMYGSSEPSYRPQVLRCIDTAKPVRMEITETRQDGSTREIEVHAIPMQYQGKPHVLTIARDITDEKRSAEELTRQREALYQREKLAALGSLLAGVAHELNNPLSVVVARAVMLEEKGDPATRAAAVKIRAAADRCARIVRTFLAMARQQQPERGRVAINDVVSAALDITAYAVRTSGIEVELDLAAVPPIHADADQLHQVLLNLVINAQHALQDHPGTRRIHVSTRHDAELEAVHITVADSGPGIPAELRKRVFEPYFTTKPIGIGTGVGLAVSLGIVEAHGGTLSVDCPPDGGAIFRILLPVGSVVPGSAEAGPQGAPSAQRCRILVVDDEAEIREALNQILTEACHRVVTASSGREALERLARERYDVILTDIRMPDVDGRALYQQIEQRWPERAARVAFVTGDTLTSALRDFAAASGRPVIEKPFLPVDVRRVVAELAAA
ncbi:MAG TPA: ATP-binding protein [Burkholderiales bacterium]|nr:ATP-binding protein [Burkholderiales bacterium]